MVETNFTLYISLLHPLHLTVVMTQLSHTPTKRKMLRQVEASHRGVRLCFLSQVNMINVGFFLTSMIVWLLLFVAPTFSCHILISAIMLVYNVACTDENNTYKNYRFSFLKAQAVLIH